MRTKYTLEAERVLNEFLGRALRDSEINALSDFAEPNEEDIASARKAALDYAHARNTNARTRHYNQENEHAKEGVKSAQDWFRRKQKSTIRKG